MEYTRLLWSAPRERTDGTPLTQEEIDAMVYTVGYQTMGQADQVYIELASFPGTLNPNGQYEQPFNTLGLPAEDLDLAMKAQDEQGRQSPWSDEVQVLLGKGPAAPTNLVAEAA